MRSDDAIEDMNPPDDFTIGYKHGFVDALRSITAAPEDTFDLYREYLDRGKREKWYQQANNMESYIRWCEDNGETPTDEGYYDWLGDQADQALRFDD